LESEISVSSNAAYPRANTMHIGIVVVVFLMLCVYAAILVAVLIPISWLLRTRPGSPLRVLGFLITALAGAGAAGVGVYWWVSALDSREREGIPVQIGAVLCWIAAFAFGWLFLYGLGNKYKRPAGRVPVRK
jgi:hypothetical protein